eukprot:TRINITY_DN18482_c0_g1_i1.p1 TRINITY_DN18482_c0_g1~~TRINITY_DN18482_c0_g1_i1.p1  ORF type:complete len:705 (+),score=148.10 TRINITY_DN18482_c0_g1_i1:176-2290(+)
MSTLEKLRQKKLLRQEALQKEDDELDGKAVAAPGPTRATGSAAALPVAVTGSGPATSSTAPVPGRPSVSKSSRESRHSSKRSMPADQAVNVPPFVADAVRCPTNIFELRACVFEFVCGAPTFGPSLPISGVSINATLRREFKKAGASAKALAIFRAADTVEVIRAICQQVRAAEPGAAAPAIVVDDSGADGEDDVLVVEADAQRIFRLLAGSSGRWPPAGDGALVKRARLDPGADAPGAAYDLPGFPWHGRGDAAQPGLGALQRSAPGMSNGSTALEIHRTPSAASVGSVDDLLKAPTARQRKRIDDGSQLRQLLAEPTARQSLTAQKFMNKSQGMAQFCPHGSRGDCRLATDSMVACSKIHFKKIIKPWTDESMGDCSYLDTCRHIDKCKYVHYTLDLTVEQAQYLNQAGVNNRGTDTKRINMMDMKGKEVPSQWIQCDLKTFPLQIFKGQISVVMADPPWDIHMELPYGTLTDEEVKNLRVGDIHEDGMIFLWVTGRAMELARECFRIWGYKRIEEIIWVKTNQLQRIIRTGRTGHWINHAKEHCLVGIKGNPRLNRNLDCDVIVSEVRETSRKPDEIYNLIERMFPNCLKLELFGRPHNVHENWITLGNQLDGVRLSDEELVRRYNKEFPRAQTVVHRKEREAVLPLFTHERATPTGFAAAAAAVAAGGGDSNGAWKPPTEAWVPPAAPPCVPPPAGLPPS